MVRRGTGPRLLVASAVAGLCGCSGARPEALGVFDTRGLDADAAEVGQPVSSLPPAMLGNEPVTWDDLHPLMVEIAGPAALGEVVLERELTREMAARGLTLSDRAVDAEESILRETMSREGRTTPDEASRLLDSMRRARGLGPVRFAGLLRRNAMLRALVRGGVTVDEDDVRTAYAVRYGPKVRARVLLVPTQRQAAELRALVEPGSPPAPVPYLSMAFADLAAKYSTDPSGARGGSLPPLSVEDPSYPAAALAALKGMKPGDVTEPVAAPGGFALFLLEGREDAAGAPEMASVDAALREDVRHVRERLAMDDLARRMLEAAPLRVHDRALEGARSR